MAIVWKTCPMSSCHRHSRCVYKSCRSLKEAGFSLTGLTLVEDDTMPLTEVRVHPELVYRVRRAFVEADLLRSVHQVNPKQFPHPFTSVGDEDAMP